MWYHVCILIHFCFIIIIFISFCILISFFDWWLSPFNDFDFIIYIYMCSCATVGNKFSIKVTFNFDFWGLTKCGVEAEEEEAGNTAVFSLRRQTFHPHPLCFFFSSINLWLGTQTPSGVMGIKVHSCIPTSMSEILF